jgi:type IV pilus assembly protein PilC
MATYLWEARDLTGQIVRGADTALDEVELDQSLRTRRLVLVKARVEVRRKRGRANARTLIDFCYHMATVVEAGIPLLTGLRDLREGGASPLAQELEDMANRIERGQQLSDTMEAYPEIFPELVSSLVGAGEETGQLDRILRNLTAYLEWREDLRRKISGAITYPIIVVLGLIGLVVLLTTVVLPSFLDIFIELKVELPLPTRALIAFQGAAEAYWPHALIALVALAVGYVLAWRSEPGRLSIHRFNLRIPVLGEILSMIEMSRLSHNLGLLYSAGIPITRAIELLETIVQNRAIRGVVHAARDRIARGESLTAALGEDGLMPTMVQRMIQLGETSGNLENSLDHVARFYDREVPARIDRALAFVNTGVVIALGATLGTVAFAIFVPMYRMMGNLNGV